MNRKNVTDKIMEALPKAHPDISIYETGSFKTSLEQFSTEILNDIVLKRLNQLIENPNLKR